MSNNFHKMAYLKKNMIFKLKLHSKGFYQHTQTLFECKCIKRVLTGDAIFTSLTGDSTTILCGHLSHAKVLLLTVQGIPSLLSYLKTLSIGPALGNEPMNFCSEFKSSTD